MYYFKEFTYTSSSFLILLLIYLIRVYPSYAMAKKANLKDPWMMLIPILGELQMFHLAGISYWYFILTFIPILNILITIIVLYKIFKNFGFGLLSTIIGIIFSLIAFWYIVLSDRKFVGSIPWEYQNDLVG
ncbi:hypothetical protein JJB46_06130 [Clostridium perfringens]|uniref:Uncharacterized protein n=1 Tax=Clostridium perfringens TaxID=1502 RepID=A0A133NEQ8_CLOPF|nr:DUF5684 domain-containing protein [Clostridium perfringens]EGT4143780.1 hypothetical protein [Clostridium perfringens]EIW6614190.1 hypothetical protein [Clostridium perfringens]ELC8361373.1 hypothetical protein [Clostridium perfringens]KXA14785.1 hypothetical protein HMPREF3222_00110 [Clostridium perfringens]MBO3387838.1 hypothetical protein [Clostridium perfringens]